MKYFPCKEIACPASDVRKALRIGKIGLLPPQLLHQQLAFRDIHRYADIVAGLSGWIVMAYATHEPNGAIGATNSEFDIVVLSRTDRIL